MNAQFFLFYAIYIFGLSVSAPVRAEVGRLAYVGSGFVIGSVLVVAGSMLLSVVGMYSANTLLFVGGLSFLYSGYVLFRQRWREHIYANLTELVLPGLVILIVVQYNFAILSYDSFKMLQMGQQIAARSGIDDTNGVLLASWGIFLPLLQGYARFMHVDLLYACVPTFFLFGWLFVAGLFSKTLKLTYGVNQSNLLSFIPIAVLATSYFFLFETFFLHNSMLSSIFLCAALLLFVWLHESAWSSPALRAVLFCLVAGFTMQRTESPLVVLLFLTLWLSLCRDDRHYRYLKAFSHGYTLFVVIWHTYVYLSIGSGSDILTPTRIVILTVPHVVFSLFVSWCQDSVPLRHLATVSHQVLLLLLLGALAVLIDAQPDHMLQSISSLAGNMLHSGAWAEGWTIALFLLVLPSVGPRHAVERVYNYFPLLFILLIICFSSERVPYRLGWGDSGNRMLTHVMPLIYMGGMIKLVKIWRAANTALTVRMWFAIAGTTLALIGTTYLSQLRYNLLEDATISATVPFHEVLTLESVIVDQASNNYAAGESYGECEVTFRLPTLETPRVLEWVDYTADTGLKDYAWAVSHNGEHWQTMFDSRTPNNWPWRREIDGTDRRYVMSARPLLRFIKLIFREGAGQDRVLVRKIALYNK